MLKKFFTLILLFSALSFARERDAEFNLTVPKFIPFNTRFDISLVSTNIQDDADTLLLMINTSERLHLNSVWLKTLLTDLEIEFSEAGDSDSGYRLYIDLKGHKILPGDFFQLILQLKPESILSGNISIDGIFLKEGEEIGRLDIEGKNPYAEVNFYKPNKTAGKCLELKTGEEFKVTNADDNVKQLLTEFWAKFNTPGSPFLKVVNASGEEFRLRLSPSQVLYIDSDCPVLESFPVFVSNRTWNHFAVMLSPSGEKISFYCNDVRTASFSIKGKGSGRMQFDFENLSRSPIYIDLFRFISPAEEEAILFRDRNYLSFISEGASLLEQITFDEQPALRNNSSNISYSSLSLVKSDAPLFQRAPELNVKILNMTLLLEWTGGDYKQADQYVVERSSGSGYRPLDIVTADNRNEKNYSYIDPKEDGDDILYYRIKQINKDGSSVYSPEVKIGQGFFEPFTIEQNFPNPFNPKTSIEIELLVDSEVDIVVYNLEGSEIARLYKGTLNKGVHKFSFNGEGLPSGIYLYKISTPEYSQTRKMILAK